MRRKIAEYRNTHDEEVPADESRPRKEFSNEAFVDAIVKFIVADD